MTTTFPKRARRDDPHGHMVVQDNLEFLRDAFDANVIKAKRGTGSLPSSATSVIITHAIGVASYSVAVTPLADPGSRFWVSNKTATQFQFNLQTAIGSALPFDWIVRGD